FGLAENTDDLFVGKTLLHGDVLMWLMKTLLTSRCVNQRGAGQINSLAEIYPCTNYDYGIFSIWTDLLDELYLLENEGEYYSHLELTKANKSVYIEKQLRHFIVLLNSKVPHDFVHLSICEECNKLVKVSWQSKTRISVFRKLLQIFKFLEPQYCTECLVCGSTHIVHLQTVEAREKALKML
ncbi:hypothetical protein J1786_26630, partial [Rahnella sp. L72c]